MDKITIKKGQVLHQSGDAVRTLEILLAGTLILEDCDDIEIPLSSGSIIGASYQPEETYTFDYTAGSDATLLVLDYQSDEDILEAVTNTPAIAPVIAATSMKNAAAMLAALSSSSEAAEALCRELAYQYREYTFMCVKLHQAPERFAFVEALSAPEASGLSSSWEASLCHSCCDQQEALKQGFYPLDLNFCMGTVMQASSLERKIRHELEGYAAFIEQTKTAASSFTDAYYQVKARLDTQLRGTAEERPAIQNALDMILAFSGVARETADAFRKDVRTYTATKDRLAKSDEMRQLRRRIADNFYQIYEAAFFKSMETENVPIEVRMFFLFGFVDEELAGRSNTELLYRTAVSWQEDSEGRILSIYDWLTKIFNGAAVPSKNEFDNDWNEYLREEQRSGALSSEQAETLQSDTRAMVRFEIQNMFRMANRTTHGRLASFVPIFHAQDVIRPLDQCLADPARVRDAFQRVIDIDYSCFYRPALTAFSEFKIPHFVYHTEVLPYIILLPNFGSRGLMWQEIEGARRSTPAHMMLSVFHSEDLYETAIRMCSMFRWEMCRRIQGVRYADISEPSLTSEYTNYLQFYRRNSYLSSDVKDRIKLSLQKARNDYKKVFMADYEKYIQNEACGLSKLTKAAREILFRYCTFSKKIREERAASPQYRQLMDRWSIAQNTKIHNVDLIMRKIQRINPENIPAEVEEEASFLSR
ncbi:MAG: hypothetical protein SO362_06080 [Selenomonas montiformis]|nr:hypothetical protein [Selenomonas montiformis]